MVKSLPAVWEIGVWSLGQEDPLEKEMATHFSILAWKIPQMEEPGSLNTKREASEHCWIVSFHKLKSPFTAHPVSLLLPWQKESFTAFVFERVFLYGYGAKLDRYLMNLKSDGEIPFIRTYTWSGVIFGFREFIHTSIQWRLMGPLLPWPGTEPGTAKQVLRAGSALALIEPKSSGLLKKQ